MSSHVACTVPCTARFLLDVLKNLLNVHTTDALAVALHLHMALPL